MIYVIEYNYPSKMLVEHINNYLEKKRVRNLPVKLVYNGNISYIDYDLKNIYFFSCQGNSGINAYKELERIRRNDPSDALSFTLTRWTDVDSWTISYKSMV